MYRQVEQAIIPDLSLQETIEDWDSIRVLLTEGQRKRKTQMTTAFL